jgi:hypothetical protein
MVFGNIISTFFPWDVICFTSSALYCGAGTTDWVTAVKMRTRSGGGRNSAMGPETAGVGATAAKVCVEAAKTGATAAADKNIRRDMARSLIFAPISISIQTKD